MARARRDHSSANVALVLTWADNIEDACNNDGDAMPPAQKTGYVLRSKLCDPIYVDWLASGCFLYRQLVWI